MRTAAVVVQWTETGCPDAEVVQNICDDVGMCTGDWRKLHSEELYYLYCSPDMIRAIR